MLRSLLLIATILMTSFAVSASNLSINPTPKVALLISGYANQGDPSLSYDQEELAQTYLVLHNNGVAIDIVSPNGGPVLVKTNKDDLDYIQTFKQNTPALAQLSNTVSATQALKNQYDGLFIVGGDGAMFDLPVHDATVKFIQKFARENVPMAAVCHGPAALVNIKMADGSYFVADKTVNSFTRVEDFAFKKEHTDKYPFIAQTQLEQRGAKFVANRPMLPFVAEDGNLITAQNPMSVALAAEALLLKLDITPKPRQRFRDEATMALISQARSQGPLLIDLALKVAPQQYDLNYLALYGFYAYPLAESAEDKRIELALMAKIAEHFSHPMYQQALIKAYVDLGLLTEAKQVIQRFEATYPNETLPQGLYDKVHAK